MLHRLAEKYDDILLYIKISVFDQRYHLATINGNKAKTYSSTLLPKVKYYGIGIIYKVKQIFCQYDTTNEYPVYNLRFSQFKEQFYIRENSIFNYNVLVLY